MRNAISLVFRFPLQNKLQHRLRVFEDGAVPVLY